MASTTFVLLVGRLRWNHRPRQPGHPVVLLAVREDHPMMGMELWRPNWFKIMKSCAFDNLRANELVSVTDETARLALSAITAQNAQDYYHNYGAAARELINALEASPSLTASK